MSNTTYAERTAYIKGLLTAGKTALATGLDDVPGPVASPTVEVYGGVGRPVAEAYSFFVVRWAELEHATQPFTAGQKKRGTSEYRIIAQAKVAGLDAAEQAALALDLLDENLEALLQEYEVAPPYWYTAQLVGASADIRPNINTSYNTVDYSQWWQTHTWSYRVKWEVTRA